MAERDAPIRHPFKSCDVLSFIFNSEAKASSLTLLLRRKFENPLREVAAGGFTSRETTLAVWWRFGSSSGRGSESLPLRSNDGQNSVRDLQEVVKGSKAEFRIKERKGKI